MTVIYQFVSKRKAMLKDESGFSLVEVIIAMLVMTVMLLGTLTVFTYAVQYNRGNNLRSQALTVLQQEAEIYRSTKFTPAVTDSTLSGGTKTPKFIPSADGTIFRVNVTVDNDPTTPTVIETSETMPSGKPCTLKEIKILVTPRNAEAAWQTAIVTDLTIQRVRGN
jgi:prepilin-type N-terminal cleavage/methylation domain-containing protein